MRFINISPVTPLLLFSEFVRQVNASPEEYDGLPNPNLMTPNPNPYRVKYGDGMMSPLIQLKMEGQITSSPNIYEETVKSGFTVSPLNGTYFYLDVDDDTGSYKDTGLIAGLDDPNLHNVSPHAADRRQQKMIEIQKAQNMFGRRRKLVHNDVDEREHEHRRTALTTGVMKNLVVPIKFSNHVGRNLPTQSDLDALMNNDGPHTMCPTGSVRDVYRKSSFDQLDIQSVVLDWITIDYTENYCADNYYGVTRNFHICLVNALEKAVAGGLDLSEFDGDEDGYIDGITFFHSGYAAEFGGIDAYGTSTINRIWSHVSKKLYSHRLLILSEIVKYCY